MNNSFGSALADFMKQNHLTQQEVAERTGIAQPVIGRLLKVAQPELPTIRKIADGLKVDVHIGADGDIVIDPIDLPARLEIAAHHSDLDPGRVHITLFDKHEKRMAFEATLRYRLGEREPYDMSFKRHEWIPGYVSNYGLLRWVNACAENLLRASPGW